MAEETAAAVEVAATIEVDGFREFWLASGRLGSSTYANCERRKVSHAERARFLELTRAGRIDTGTDYVGIWLRDRHWKLLPDFKLQRTGFTVYRDTRQGGRVAALLARAGHERAVIEPAPWPLP